jgi:thioredoxin 1
MGAALEVHEQNFEAEVLNSTEPVLVDFWAPWCGPCRMIGPVIEELAKDNAGKAKIAKLNTDEAQELAMRYDVQSIPTIMIFMNGEVVDRFMGVQPKQRLQQAIDAARA